MMLSAALSIALCATELLCAAILARAALWHLPHLTRLPAPTAPTAQDEHENLPAVSIIVPARNEERRLPTCLAALLRQDYPAYEVIVVDDESTDRTAAVVRSAQLRHRRLRFVAGARLPDGWVGKPWALHQGAQAARGAWLFFVDADAVCVPRALRALLAHALAHSLDALTLLPRQETRTFWERAVQPVVFSLLLCGLDPAKLAPPRDDRHTVANGQALLIRRAVYDSLGGHAAVRGAIVEDFALARKLRENGRCLRWVDGRALVRVRMYRSLAELWQGWGKNLLLPGLLGGVERVGLMLLTVLVGPLPYLLALLAAAWLAASPNSLPARLTLALATLALGLLLRLHWGLRRFHTGGIPALLLHPLGAAVVAILAVATLWRQFRRAPTSWRGRHYRLDDPRRVTTEGSAVPSRPPTRWEGTA